MSIPLLKSQSAKLRPNALLRVLLGDLEFSIISNNCWGAHVYQILGLPYRTPFVGLFIPPKSYIHLLRNFAECIYSELVFIQNSKLDRFNSWRERERLSYPIGLLGNEVEIHFLHYGSDEEARSKWRRRCTRLIDDPKRCYFKFDDRDGAVAEDFEAFDRMSIPNKVCFSASKLNVPTVVVPGEPGARQALDGVSLARVSRHYFNTLRWLSTRPAWLPLPSLM